VETIITFLRELHASDSPGDSLPHKIVLLLRKDPPKDLADDLYFFTFKTWEIRTLVQGRFAVLRLEDVRCLFDTTKSLFKSSTLARFAFESLANGYISGKHQQELNKGAKLLPDPVPSSTASRMSHRTIYWFPIRPRLLPPPPPSSIQDHPLLQRG